MEFGEGLTDEQIAYQERKVRHKRKLERVVGQKAARARARQIGVVATLLFDLAYLSSSYQENGELSFDEVLIGGILALVATIYLAYWNGTFAKQEENAQEDYHRTM